MPATAKPRPLYYIVRQSRIHGRGVFARRTIRKGARIIEYRGERISVAEADRREGVNRLAFLVIKSPLHQNGSLGFSS